MSKEIENIREQLNWHWRNNMRPVRFFMLDARAVIPFLVLLIYFRPSTLILTCLITAFFYILERKGLTVPAALRMMRSWVTGRERPGWISVHRKRFKDYG